MMMCFGGLKRHLMFTVVMVFWLSEVETSKMIRNSCEKGGGICVKNPDVNCENLPSKCPSQDLICCKNGVRKDSSPKRKKRKCRTKRKCWKKDGRCLRKTDCQNESFDHLCQGDSCTCCVKAPGCKCGEANPNRIIGGEEVVPPHKYPWMAGIRNADSPDYYFCAGSIINERYVLSAAHCFLLDIRLEVVVGDHLQTSTEDDISGVTTAIKVERVMLHRKPDVNDIALVRLVKRLDLTSHPQVGAVCLPPDASNSYAGKEAIAIGWGIDKFPEPTDNDDYYYYYYYEPPEPQDSLLVVTLPILGEECIGKKIAGTKITDKMLCAGYEEGGKDTCSGDSGGPLTVVEDGKHILVGITSFGEGCALPGSPGVYTRVSKYLKWIKKNTADVPSCG